MDSGVLIAKLNGRDAPLRLTSLQINLQANSNRQCTMHIILHVLPIHHILAFKTMPGAYNANAIFIDSIQSWATSGKDPKATRRIIHIYALALRRRHPPMVLDIHA